MGDATCHSQHVGIEVQADDTPCTRLQRRGHDTRATREVELVLAKSHASAIDKVFGPEPGITWNDVGLV